MRQIVVGMATCGVAAGADKVYEKLKEEIQARGVEDRVKLKITGCIGMCYREPLVEVREEDGRSIIYADVDPKRAVKILEKHALGGEPIPGWVLSSRGFEGISGEGNQLLAGQVRIVLRNCGIIDPENIDDYLARDGYKALEKVLKTMTPEEVIDEIYKSGLRGRGGAGFPTGLKWKFTREAKGDKKYVVCNADEGDPGAFMDRSTLEGDPHSVLEGMLIAAYAIGADEGYIYVRAEYPRAIHRLKIAIAQAEERGFIGDNIFGTDFSFHIHIKEGAGAFVCGEETALLQSIEGKRGMPRVRPVSYTHLTLPTTERV